MSERWDAWKDGYDAWKLRSPHPLPDYDWEHYREPLCFACMDVGWLDDEGHAVPCPECSAPVALDDLLEASP